MTLIGREIIADIVLEPFNCLGHLVWLSFSYTKAKNLYHNGFKFIRMGKAEERHPEPILH